MNLEVIYLFIALFTKHTIADFVLQTEFMLRKGDRRNWIGPLLDHAMVHGFFTMLIALVAGGPLMFWLGIVDFVIHAIIDRVKARHWPYKDGRGFWIGFGVDQYLHLLTYALLIYLFYWAKGMI